MQRRGGRHLQPGGAPMPRSPGNTKSVDDRIRAQVEIWRRQAYAPEEAERAEPAPVFLTLSRQFGCHAFALAEAVVRRIEVRTGEVFEIFDRKLLEEISGRRDVASRLIESLTERTRSEVEDWVVGLFSGAESEMSAYRRLARTVCAIATKGRCILIGRGSAVLTRDLPGGIHVRLVAPVEWRVRTLKLHPHPNVPAEREAVLRMDLERESFIRKYLGADVNDPTLYHLVLNNARLSIGRQAELILHLIETITTGAEPLGLEEE